ncbi:MAG TPA: flagellar type III secretion system pore protein FliP [Candidatus Eremiobacteraeota bacterium]|nr:MAG: Flagellar biosynthetic protein FliP precursor [bacterium ADurb.Bin363]HPZ07027.1 flagellar type III secretion system pore protein FliP [Candidatus Eremiobacteraeota bacterium]
MIFNRKSTVSLLIFLIVLFSSYFTISLLFSNLQEVKAAENPLITFPKIDVNITPGESGETKRGEAIIPKDVGVMLPFQILIGLSLLSLAPYLIIMTTSFIRVVIVLSFIRSALGTQQVPPTQVLMGLALFLTFFIMSPVGSKMNQEAIQPFADGKIQTEEFVNKALGPVRDFMFRQVREKDLMLFLKLSNVKQKPKTKADVSTFVLIPAFMISEIKTAFEIGFAIYIPFLVVDMVVSSVLMSMGMFMLSPMTISMPFKLLLFVMVDGWGIIIESLVKSFK